MVIGIGACVALLFGGVSSCSMMAGSGVGGVFTSSYLSEDADMLAAEAAYCELEQALQYELDHYEALHPGYDEYRFDLDEDVYKRQGMAFTPLKIWKAVSANTVLPQRA